MKTTRFFNRLFVLLLLGAIPFVSWSQTGPGGVGNATTNKLWLKADAGVYKDTLQTVAAPGDLVTQWKDQSGNNEVLEQLSSTLQPTVQANQINGYPAVKFDGANDFIGSTINGGAFGTNFSLFVVSRFASLNQAPGDYDHLICVGGGYVGAGNNFSISRTASNWPSGGDLYYSYDGANVFVGPMTLAGQTWQLIAPEYFTTAPRHYVHLDGVSNVRPVGQDIQTNGLFEIGRYTSGNIHFFNGEVAEIIAFEDSLNSAHRVLVHNYLASKYQLSITNDHFAYDAGHGNEVAGIGREDANNQHTDAQGTGILRMYAPSALTDGDYLLWGHDNAALTFSGTDVPASMGSTGQRMTRTWRTDLTNNPGTVSVSFNLSGLTTPNPSELELLIDPDGTFAAVASRHTTGRSWDAVNEVLTFTDVSLTDGDFLSLGWGEMSFAFSVTHTSGNVLGSIEVNLDGGLPLVVLGDAGDISEANFDAMMAYQSGNWPAEGFVATAPSLTYEEFLQHLSQTKLENLAAGRYQVSVVDRSNPTNWVVNEKTISVGHVQDFSTLSGASFLDDVFTKSAGNGWNNMTTAFRNSGEAGTTGWLEVEAITANTKHAFGLLSDGASNTYMSSMKHGLLLDAGSIFIIDGGNTTTTGIDYLVGDRLRIGFENSTLTYYKNDQAFGVPINISTLTKFVPSVETFENGGKIRFVSSLGFIEAGATTTPLGCSSEDNGSIYIDAPNDAVFIWSDASSNSSLTNIGPGTYTVTIALPNGNATSHTYYVGNEVNWSPTNNFLFPYSTNTLQHNNATGQAPGGATLLQHASAQSLNQFPGNFTSAEEWASFEVVTQPMTGSDTPPSGWPVTAKNFPYGVYFGLEDINTGTGDYGIYVSGAGGNNANIVWFNQQGNLYPIGNAFHGDRLTIKLENQGGQQQVRVYRNNTLMVFTSNTSSNSAVYQLKTAAFHENNQIKEALCSFQCDLNPSFNRLSEQLDGQKFYTLDSKLFFLYEGEYNTGTLDYKVLSEMGTDVTNVVSLEAPDGTATTTKSFGDNRYVMDFHQLADGYYTLEVTNEKNETYSLRIYKYL